MNKKIAWSTLLMLGIIVGIGFVLTQQKNRRVAQERELLNQIFFSTVDCTAPCWKGMIPGQSSADEYQRLTEDLEKKGVILRYKSSGDDYTEDSWFDTESEMYLFTHLSAQGRIDSITLSPTTIGQISVESLLNFLGTPDYYASQFIRDIEAIISLDFLYIDEGAVVIFEGVRPNRETDDCYLDLSKLQIREISLVESSVPVNMIGNSATGKYPSSEAIQPWAGVEAIRIYGCVPKR